MNLARFQIGVVGRRGFSLVELLIVVAIMVIVMTAAIPYYQEGVSHTNELAAMQAIRALQAAQVQYFSQTGRYAVSLSEFGARAMSGDLAKGQKGSYKFRLEETKEGYAIHAEPVKFGLGGNRTFYADETMIIRENRGKAPATAASDEAK